MATTLTIDHATLAWSNLEPLESALTALSLRADYGGKHANRSTHMDVLGFDDGSYLELIAPFEPGTPMAWEAHMHGNAGPCAWAVSLPDSVELAMEAERFRDLGIAVRGPMPSGRIRPDGLSITWDCAFLGAGEPGATLPFLIADRTPRDRRVRPTASVSGTELTGIELVVLGVSDLVEAAGLMRRVYDWTMPTLRSRLGFEVTLLHFPGTPVILAADIAATNGAIDPARKPLAPRDMASGWLAQRLAQFGPAPCAYLLGTRDMAASKAHLPLVDGGRWFGREVAWLDPDHTLGIRLGVVTRA